MTHGEPLDPYAAISQPFELYLVHGPRIRVDLDAVSTRYRGILRATTTEEMRSALVASVVDVPTLVYDLEVQVSEVDRLWRLLGSIRLQYANLAAAAQAALSAHRDGETEPLAYLTDELHGSWPTESRSAYRRRR